MKKLLSHCWDKLKNIVYDDDDGGRERKLNYIKSWKLNYAEPSLKGPVLSRLWGLADDLIK